MKKLQKKVAQEKKLIKYKHGQLPQFSNRPAAQPMMESKLPGGHCIWKIKYYEYRLRKARQDRNYSLIQEFPCADNRYTMRATLYLFGTGSAWGRHMSVFLRVADGPAEALHYRMTIRLLDQSEGEKRHVYWTDEPLLGSTTGDDWMEDVWGRQEFVSLDLLADSDRYVVDDTIILELRVHPVQWIARYFARDDGILVWTVDNYALRKRNEIEGIAWCHYSESFYSAPGGRRMRAQLFLNGYGAGQGTHLTVCLGVLEGVNDEQLPRRFDRRVSFTVMDRHVGGSDGGGGGGEDFSRFYVVDSSKIGNKMADRITATYWGVHQFASHALVEKDDSPYLIDDSIVIVIEVDTLN